MAGLVPAIHVFASTARKTWMPGTRPGMTTLDGARPGVTSQPTSLLRLAGVLHRLKGLELDIVELAIDLLHLADVDVLHDVARFRIDRDRAARAFPLHALHGLDQLVAVGVAAGLLQRLIDQVNAVIAADRNEAGTLV